MNARVGLLGIGLYTLSEVAPLAELSPERVRGWVRGYSRGPGRPPGEPVIARELNDLDGRAALSFRELIEVRFIRHFLRAGVSWRKIRRAAAAARRELFNCSGQARRFSTDGVTVFANTLAQSGDPSARDLVANQYVMLLVLAKSIRSEFDLEAEDVIRAWHPRPATRLVLLDPRRSFGHPIVEPGVPTRALADALRAEGGDPRRVATLFGISAEAVQQAAAFEVSMAA